jgi:hypothetical protein
LVGRPEGKRLLGRPRRRWEDNIKCILGRQGSMVRTGFSCSGWGPVAGFCEYSNEPSGSIRKQNFF